MAGAGADNFADATPIAVGQTSDPTPSAGLTVESGEPDAVPDYDHIRSAWWVLTPSVDQTLTFSTLGTDTSGTGDPFDYDTIIHVYTGTTLSDLTMVARIDDSGDSTYGYLSKGNVSLTGGVTYYVRVATYDDTSADMAYVLSVAVFVEPITLDWQDAPDAQYVFSMNGGSGATWHIPATDTAHFFLSDSSGPAPWGRNYEGKHQFNVSFGGPHPAGDMAAVDCCWKHARRYGVGGFDYWSPGNHVEWLGGPGTCPPLPVDSPISESTFGDHPVGFRYQIETEGIGGPGDPGRNINFHLYGVCQKVSLHYLRRQTQAHLDDDGADPALAQPYIDALIAAGWTDIELEWDSDFTTELEAIEVAADEPVSGVGVGAQPLAKWYAGLAHDTTASTTSGWGPQYVSSNHATSLQGTFHFAGDVSGPETLLGWQWLGDYGGGTSGFTNIEPDLFDDAWAYESSIGTPLAPVGIFLVAVPEGCYTDTPPSVVGPYGTVVDGTQSAYRQQQAMAIRVTCTSPRFRVTATPPTGLLGRLKVWSDDTDEWLWQGEGSVSGETGLGRFKVWDGSDWRIAEPVAGEGGVGRLKVYDGFGWRTTIPDPVS